MMQPRKTNLFDGVKGQQPAFTFLPLFIPFCPLLPSSFLSYLLSAINLLKDREPGAFIIRDSHSFRGAYGLAMKVACPPPTVQQNKKGRHLERGIDGSFRILIAQSNKIEIIFLVGDLTNELVRHFLIETSSRGVRLKGCPNEPYFGESASLRWSHGDSGLFFMSLFLLFTSFLAL